jgi:hypothetical protein
LLALSRVGGYHCRRRSSSGCRAVLLSHNFVDPNLADPFGLELEVRTLKPYIRKACGTNPPTIKNRVLRDRIGRTAQTASLPLAHNLHLCLSVLRTQSLSSRLHLRYPRVSTAHSGMNFQFKEPEIKPRAWIHIWLVTRVPSCTNP